MKGCALLRSRAKAGASHLPALSVVLGCPVPHLGLKNWKSCRNWEQSSKHSLPSIARKYHFNSRPSKQGSGSRGCSGHRQEGLKEGLEDGQFCSIRSYQRRWWEYLGYLPRQCKLSPHKELAPPGTIVAPREPQWMMWWTNETSLRTEEKHSHAWCQRN